MTITGKFLSKISIGLIAGSLVGQVAYGQTAPKTAGKRLDSAGLQNTDSLKKPEELKASNPKSKKETLTSTELSNDDPSKLEKQIKAIQLILRNEKDRNKKINLYLRLSYLHVSIAKKYGVKRIKGEKVRNVKHKVT